MIQNQTWIDEDVREKIVAKVDKIRKFVGALDAAIDVQKLDDYYKRFSFEQIL
jgi:hypothetical protein